MVWKDQMQSDSVMAPWGLLAYSICVTAETSAGQPWPHWSLAKE